MITTALRTLPPIWSATRSPRRPPGGACDAFHASGALERTVAHPGMGNIPATMLFDMRLMELAVHGWDLARAIGGDETLDPEVVAAVWAFGEPLSGILPSTGYFSSPTGDVPDSAPLQTRLLDLLGRRP